MHRGAAIYRKTRPRLGPPGPVQRDLTAALKLGHRISLTLLPGVRLSAA